MRTMRSVALVALALGATGCHIGKNAAKWPVASSAGGAVLTITSSAGTIYAELLEVRDDGIVIKRQDRKIAFAPFSSMTRIEAKGLGAEYVVVRGMPPGAGTRLNLMRVSHFPQGITPEIRARLLAASGQTEIAAFP